MNEQAWHRGERDCTGDAAAYVLGALEDHEVTPFLRHMDSCAVCRDEVASLQVVADMLPAAVSPIAAPRGLRRRVLSTVYEEAGLLSAAPIRREPVRAPRRSWRPVPRAFQAFAAAALVAAGIVVGTVDLSGPSGPASRAITAVTTPPTTAVLRVSSQRTELDVSKLNPAPPGRVYEVWVQRRGQAQPTDALFSPTSGGRATVAVPGDLHGVEAVMVTAEPAGGSTAPTSTPVIRATLQ
jgi:anti-sigma-K factor RskA